MVMSGISLCVIQFKTSSDCADAHIYYRSFYSVGPDYLAWLYNNPCLYPSMEDKLRLRPCAYLISIFVCVEVLRPSRPNGVMSSAVSLHNHTFTKRLISIMHVLSPETDNCPS